MRSSVHGVVRPAAARKDTRTLTTMRELVEWTYAAQKAHRGGNGIGGGSSISGTGLLVEKLMLGCTVSGGGCPSSVGVLHCDDDALTVHGLVERMPARSRLALVRHGEARGVPEWSPLVMPLRVVPVPGRKGALKGMYDRSGNLIGREVTYEGDVPTREVAASMRWYWPDAPRLRCAEDVRAYARRLYAEWWEALAALRARLVGVRLGRWRVSGMGAACEPWAGDE